MTRTFGAGQLRLLASALAIVLLLMLVMPLRGGPMGRVHAADAHSSIPHVPGGAAQSVDRTADADSVAVVDASFGLVAHGTQRSGRGRDLGKPLGPPPRSAG